MLLARLSQNFDFQAILGHRGPFPAIMLRGPSTSSVATGEVWLAAKNFRFPPILGFGRPSFRMSI
jgi:hypothetical protein